MRRAKACAISREVKQKVYERDGGCCIFCGHPGLPEAHVLPRSHGGLGVEQNIVTACRECHREMDEGRYRKAYLERAGRYLEGIYGTIDKDIITYRKGNT